MLEPKSPPPSASPSGLPVALVIGASRGIGRQIAIDLAKNGYAVVVASKSISPSIPLDSRQEKDNKEAKQSAFPPDPNSPASTITTVSREIILAGGVATAIPVDVRDYRSVCELVEKTVALHKRLDVLIYNPGAIYWAPVSRTPFSRFQLMQQVNPGGLYAAVQACLPHLERSAATSPSFSSSSSPPTSPSASLLLSTTGNTSVTSRGRIVVVSPPIYSRFFRGKTAYAMGKIAMSVLTVGLGMDISRSSSLSASMAITSLWPSASIQSAATAKFTTADPSFFSQLRHPSIFSDAVLEILKSPAKDVNGRLLLDEDFLRERGRIRTDQDVGRYSVVPGTRPRRMMPRRFPDLSVEEQEDEGMRYDSSAEQKGKGGGGKAKL